MSFKCAVPGCSVDFDVLFLRRIREIVGTVGGGVGSRPRRGRVAFLAAAAVGAPFLSEPALSPTLLLFAAGLPPLGASVFEPDLSKTTPNENTSVVFYTRLNFRYLYEVYKNVLR